MDIAPPITLHQRVEYAIIQNPHLNSCKIDHRSDESGNLFIEGEAETYFAKQMAQEVLRNVEGVNSIENDLIVIW